MSKSWAFEKIDITPPLGLELEGFADPPRRGEKILSPLYARAMYCRDESGGAFIASLDLVGLPASLAERLRSAVAGALKLGTETVLISCTHTHSGPLTGISEARSSSLDKPELYEAYNNQLEGALVSLAEKCAAFARPGEAKFYHGESDIAYNRHSGLSGAKHPAIDNMLRVITVADAGGVFGMYVQCAAHNVLYGSINHTYCSDWTGAFCTLADERYGCCVYAQGGCGDLSPLRLGHHADENCALLSARLFDTVDSVLRTSGTEIDGPISGEECPADVPRALLTKPALDKLHKDAADARASSEPFERALGEYIIYYCGKAEDYIRTGSIPPLRVPLQMLKLGNVVFFALPFEPFSPITAAIARQTSPMAITVGYANGDFGYLPTAKAMREGGYESEDAPLFYGMYGTFAPSAPTLVKNTFIKMYRASIKTN